MVAIKDDKRTLFHEDILEPILSHVPLVDLAHASHVSKSWLLSVHSSLRYLNKPKPWLLVHTQNIWSPGLSATHAYDPRSNLWIEIKSQPSITQASAIRTSDSNLLYVITPMKLYFSTDPLRLAWQQVASPTIWRDDPVIVMVGRKIIVVGGVCDFEDNDLAVEAYDLDSGTWVTCQNMPESLRDSGMSWLLSVACDGEQMYMTEKRSGAIHVFRPEKNTWSGPHVVCPDQAVFFTITAYVAGQLILIGLQGAEIQKIKLWRVNTSSFKCEFIGEMPKSLVEKLGTVSAIGVSYSGNMMYIYSPSEVEEMVTCELLNGEGELLWNNVRNVIQGRKSMTERVVCTSSEVRLEDVVYAMKEHKTRFTVTRSLGSLTQ